MQVTARHDLTTLPGRLKFVREEVMKGTTVDDLAEKLADHGFDVSDASVSRYENGQRRPGFDYLVALSEVSGESLDFLVKGAARSTEPLKVIADLREHLDDLERRYRATPAVSDDEAQQEMDDMEDLADSQSHEPTGTDHSDD